jgi:Tol biopolymer transport system component
MALTPGSRLHVYEIVGPIGAGGMGEVYRAHDARLQRDVAVKVLPPSLNAEPGSLARFEREARATGALNHPNIVNVFDIGTESGVTYVVMELLEGETLRARLQGIPAAPGGSPSKPASSSSAAAAGLPRTKALEIAVHIAQGLAAAHARGIVHRDLKPENVFLTSDGRVKILDFGLARVMPDELRQPAEGETRLSPAVADSMPGMVLGTIGYMAPEQVRGQAVDHRADIFAFGAVLYEMLTGHRAFAGDSAIEAMTAILKADPLEQPVAAVAIPGPVAPVVRRCLEKQPDERFQSARDLAFQLQAIASAGLSTTSTERVMAGRHPARRFALPVLISILAFIAGFAADRLLFRTAPREAAISLSADMPAGVFVTPPGSSARSGGLAVSRDGRQIAFAGTGDDGVSRIFVRPLDGLPRALPGTENGSLPSFSPDGRHVAFWQPPSGLRRVPIEGGAPQTIAAMINPRAAATWGDDDTLLFHADYRLALVRVSAGGGEPSEVLPPQGEHNAWFSPIWLPGGRRFLVVRFAYRDDAADAAGIYVGTPGSNDLTLLVRGRVAEVAAGDRELVYRRGTDLIVQPFDPAGVRLTGPPTVLSDRAAMIAAGGRTIAFHEPPGGLSAGHRLTWFSRTGNVLGRVGDPGTLRDPRLSPDGRYVAVARASANGLFSLWAYDLQRSIDTRVSNDSHVAPVWGADSRTIYSGMPQQIVRFEVGGDPAGAPVTAVKEYPALFDVTPDGRHAIAFLLEGRPQLVSIDLHGTSEPRPIGGVVGTVAAGNDAGLAPDGNWVVARVASGPLHAVPLEGSGRRIPVSGDATAFHPRWRRDGRELFYLASAPSSSAQDFAIFAVAVTWNGGIPDFGPPQQLFTVKNIMRANFAFDVTADGQKFIAIAADIPTPWPLTVRVHTQQ